MHDLRNKITAVALTLSSALMNTGCSKEEASPETERALAAGVLLQRGKAWTFEECLAFVLDKEGGLSTNRADRGNKNGGSTMYGVTQATYDLYRESRHQGSRHVAHISPAEVQGVYKELFWDKVRCDQMPDPELKLLMFDASVNHGTGGAIKLLQRALGSVRPDGDFGPKTANALAAATDLEMLKERFLDARVALYERIIANDSSQKQFKNGWMNRVEKMRRTIAEPVVTVDPGASETSLEQASMPQLNAHTYTVKKGDSLWSIAQRELHDVKRVPDIAALNGIDLKNPALDVGQKLVLPAK